MDTRTKELRIADATWCGDIEAMLLTACGGVIDEIKAQVLNGVAHLFDVTSEDKRIAAFVLRVDELTSGPQGVIVAAGGDGEGINLTDNVLPAIERMFHGCTSVRIHTKRRGLAQKIMQDGYMFEEIVLKKALP